MTEKYTIKDVGDDLSFLMSLTKIFAVDADGFWIDRDDEKRFKYDLGSNDEGKEIVNFQDPLPKGDFYYFNPFAEGFGKRTPAVQLFYKSIRVALNINLRVTMLHVVAQLLESKEDKEKSLGHAVVRMSSVPVDKKSTVFDLIDDKTIGEFEKILDRMNGEIVHLPYLNNQMTAKVKIDTLTDDQWEKKFTDGIRKKTIGAFRSVLLGVLGIKSADDLDQFTVKYDPDLKSSARLHTTLLVILKLYSRFNDVLEEAYVAGGSPPGRDEVDLGGLQETIDRLPLAYAIAKHMVQPSLPKNSANDPSASDTSRLTMGGAGGSRRFAGPEIVGESRWGAPSGRPITKSRFSPQLISDAPIDPFAPATRAAPSQGSAFGTTGGFGSPGWGTSSGGFGAPNQGGYFGGGGGSFGGSPFNTNPPSNFGSPSQSRRYF